MSDSCDESTTRDEDTEEAGLCPASGAPAATCLDHYLAAVDRLMSWTQSLRVYRPLCCWGDRCRACWLRVLRIASRPAAASASCAARASRCCPGATAWARRFFDSGRYWVLGLPAVSLLVWESALVHAGTNPDLIPDGCAVETKTTWVAGSLGSASGLPQVRRFVSVVLAFNAGLFGAVTAAVLGYYSHASFLRHATSWAVIRWMFDLTIPLQILTSCSRLRVLWLDAIGCILFAVCYNYMIFLSVLMFTWLQEALLRDLGAQALQGLLPLFLFALVGCEVAYWCFPPARWVLTLLATSTGSAYAWFALLACHRSLFLARQAVCLARGHQAEDARLSLRAVRDASFGLFMCCFSNFLFFCYQYPRFPLGPYVAALARMRRSVSVMDVHAFNAAVSCTGVALLAGVHRGSLSGVSAARLAEEERAGKRGRAMAAYSPDPDARWQEKVEELAGRGVRLSGLLAFYRGLGRDYMPHYSPARHSTSDVVRGAIIPLSAPGRCSLAEVMSGGLRVEPGRMVTHNWGNLFSHLVAAIVADALEEDEFGDIVAMLEGDIDELESWIEQSGGADRTYWVCAFSVSQHDGICGANPRGTRDSVTGLPHAICECGKAKYWNDTPPLRADGEAIRCEMNKFDDMMGFLAASSPSFAQVVAVDAEFELFSRAWCVAELAEAHGKGLQQSLKVLSRECVESHCALLRNMRIEDMSASRPEDVAAILQKIPDKAEFNARVRASIAQAFADWCSMDRKVLFKHVGRLLRHQARGRAAAEPGPPAPWKVAP